MRDASAGLSNQVLKTENGQVIAFWRGELVLKLDRGVRYFETEHQAWNFLARRESFANSSVSSSNARKRRSSIGSSPDSLVPAGISAVTEVP